MAKKIRFPLKLAEGAEVRTLEELREHFDLQAILEYYKSGKLLTWLEDRYLEGEAEAVQALDESAADFQRRLCEMFQVEYTGAGVDMEEIERRQERLKWLRTVTDDAECIQNIDSVAFDQEELADLLDEGATKIYLCGDKFTVPAFRKGITYVGIKNPAVHISGKVPETAEELDVEFKNICCDNLPVVHRPEAKEESAPAAEAASGVVNVERGQCSDPVVGKYLRFMDAIGVKGYTEAFVEKAIQCIKPAFVGYISSFLGITKEQLANVGLTDKLSQEFPDKVNAAMDTVPDYRVLGAMGWPDIGPARAKILLKHYGGLAKFVEGFKSDGFGCEWRRALGEVGAKSAKTIQSNFNNWCSLRDDLMYTATWIGNVTTDFSEKIKVGHTGGNLTGDTIDLCKKLRMEVVDDESFDILITASENFDSEKMEKARKKGLLIYTADEFAESFAIYAIGL